MDPEILGYWRVTETQMIEDRCLALVAGLPDEIVEFTDDGVYRVDFELKKPHEYRYKIVSKGEFGEIDIWQPSLEALANLCLYTIRDGILSIGMSGVQGKLERPTRIVRDDSLLWCVKKHVRAEPPRRARKSRSG